MQENILGIWLKKQLCEEKKKGKGEGYKRKSQLRKRKKETSRTQKRNFTTSFLERRVGENKLRGGRHLRRFHCAVISLTPQFFFIVFPLFLSFQQLFSPHPTFPHAHARTWNGSSAHRCEGCVSNMVPGAPPSTTTSSAAINLLSRRPWDTRYVLLCCVLGRFRDSWDEAKVCGGGRASSSDFLARVANIGERHPYQNLMRKNVL